MKRETHTEQNGAGEANGDIKYKKNLPAIKRQLTALLFPNNKNI